MRDRPDQDERDDCQTANGAVNRGRQHNAQRCCHVLTMFGIIHKGTLLSALNSVKRLE